MKITRYFVLGAILLSHPGWAAKVAPAPVLCNFRQGAFDGATVIVIPVASGLIDHMPAKVGNPNGPDTVFDKSLLKKRYVDDQSCFFIDWARPCIPAGFNDVIPAPHSQVTLLATQGKGAPKSYSPSVDGGPVSAYGNPLGANPKLIPGLFLSIGFFYCGPHLALNEPFDVRLVSGHDNITLTWPEGSQETGACNSASEYNPTTSNSTLPSCGGDQTASGILWERGQSLFRKNDFEAAQKYFQRIMLSYPTGPNSAQAYFYNAECYFRLNQMKQASDAYRAYFEFYPNDASAAEAKQHDALARKNLPK